MPHRTTYFFPRQFPDRGFDSFSHKNDHEKKSSSNVGESFGFERDNHKSNGVSEDSYKDKEATTVFSSNSLLSKSSAVSDLFSDDRKSEKKQQQQLAAFYEWLAEKKANLSRSSATTGRVKSTRLSMSSDADEERELLLSPPDPAPLPATSSPDSVIAASSSSARAININERNIDRSFDREVSLPRMSSESSFAGSFFSGTTVDGNFSNFSSPTDARETSTTTRVSVAKEEEEVEVRDEGKEQSLAQKSKEGYYLQVTLARRLSSQANLTADSVHTQSTETVSGCLSYSDKISDGFYSILGMDPYLWLMCNNSEEGKRLPSLLLLKETEPNDTSMEVVLIDRREDSRLKELEEGT